MLANEVRGKKILSNQQHSDFSRRQTCLICGAGQAGAAVYGQLGVRGKTITVCFVGNAATIWRPDRVNQIMAYLNDYTYAANVTFQLLGDCAAAGKQANGNDFYAGDIRVVIPSTGVTGTGMVPGNGCTMFIDPKTGKYNHGNDGWGSWSNFPTEAVGNTACLYNLKLGDDGSGGVPYLNHTLHEFGHALGLAHEHERTDVDKTICAAPGFGGGISSGFLTPYDRYSVMHYQFYNCGINGNYDNTGLSSLDRLAAHILYPEEGLVAEYIGTIVVQSTQPVNLQSAWKVRGANMSYVASGFKWTVDGSLKSASSDLNALLPVGVNSFSLTHKDFLGRTYTYNGTITVLSPSDYENFAAATQTGAFPLM